ncbi:MAG: Trm112 family protein [Pseudomonadales bacterium]|nr:Trm112 family protein [Pseudomonadales bacterium]MCP5183295.1 Trm112 family protein [Pseudomonadales bacterium]
MTDAPLDSRLLEVLVCPVTKAPLFYRRERNELWCRQSELAYPIQDGIPVMVEDEARQLTAEELRSLERA